MRNGQLLTSFSLHRGFHPKELAQIPRTSSLRAEKENPGLQCLEKSEMTDGVRQVAEMKKKVLPSYEYILLLFTL